MFTLLTWLPLRCYLDGQGFVLVRTNRPALLFWAECCFLSTVNQNHHQSSIEWEIPISPSLKGWDIKMEEGRWTTWCGDRTRGWFAVTTSPHHLFTAGTLASPCHRAVKSVLELRLNPQILCKFKNCRNCRKRSILHGAYPCRKFQFYLQSTCKKTAAAPTWWRRKTIFWSCTTQWKCIWKNWQCYTENNTLCARNNPAELNTDVQWTVFLPHEESYQRQQGWRVGWPLLPWCKT